MKNLWKYFTTALSLSLLLILGGCGFHLRGQNVLPPQLHCLRLQSCTPYADFETTLRNYLVTIGVNVTRTQCAPVILHVLGAGLGGDVPTIGGSNQARVYVYYYTVTFEVHDDQNHQLLPIQTVTATRTIIVNAGTTLESTGQITVVTHELQLEACQMIVNMLNAPAMYK